MNQNINIPSASSSTIPDYVLNEIKCCLHEDQHILLEPVLLKCGGNACKGCIDDHTKSSFKCFKCNLTHDKIDFIENKSIESLIRFVMKDLSKNLDHEIKSMKSLLSEENVLDEMQLKIESLEDQMDLRVESLISEIHKCRDEYMEKLKKYKVDLQKRVQDANIFEKCKIKDNNKNEDVDGFKIFQNKQTEIKMYKKELLSFRNYIDQFKFTPSKFGFIKEQFGCINTVQSSSWLKSSFTLNDICLEKKEPLSKKIETEDANHPFSLILNDDEASWLAEITQSSKGTLLYRATRDGFTANAFHAKCDGKAKTITIIKTNGNYVFGGYTSAAWNKAGTYIADTNAFIFSLRRNGVSKCEKFMVKNPNAAIIGHKHYGPIFGGGNGNAVNNYCGYCGSFNNSGFGNNKRYNNNNCSHGSNYSYISENGLVSGCDIFIRDGSNSSYVCEANIGGSYQCPEGYVYGQQNTIDYLAGSNKNFLTTEIEVFEITEVFE